MKVLIVDDEEELRMILAEQLQQHDGVDILEAANGLEGLWQVKHEHPDVIVLDLMMPRLGGIEALKRINAFDPRIKVIVLTASMDPVQHQAARRFGAAEVFTKPYDLEQLARMIARHATRPAV